MTRFNLYYRKGIVSTFPFDAWKFSKIHEPVEKLTVEIPDGFEVKQDGLGITGIYKDGVECDVYRKATCVFMLLWKKNYRDTAGQFQEMFVQSQSWEKIS